MAFSIELELADGGTVIYDNVVSYTVEESEPSPDEVPEEGEEDREEGSDEDELEVEVDLSEEDIEEGEELANPMEKEEDEAKV